MKRENFFLSGKVFRYFERELHIIVMYVGVAKLADAPDLKSVVIYDMRVRIPSPASAPLFSRSRACLHFLGATVTPLLRGIVPLRQTFLDNIAVWETNFWASFFLGAMMQRTRSCVWRPCSIILNYWRRGKDCKLR